MWLTALPLAEGLKVPLIIAPFLPPSYASTEYAPPLMRPRPFPLGFLNLVAGWVGEEVFIGTHQPLLPKLRIMQAEAGYAAPDWTGSFFSLVHKLTDAPRAAPTGPAR